MNPTPPVAAWASFLHADEVMNVHPPTLWYFMVRSVCTLRCSCTPRISTPLSSTQCASSSSRASSLTVCIEDGHDEWPLTTQKCIGQRAVVRLDPSSPRRVWGPVVMESSQERTSTAVRCLVPADSHRWKYRICVCYVLHVKI